MSRAERFEDERRRITASCFSKIDPEDGQLLESYITHIRIQEDAAYPQSPAPPESDPKNKKQRVIVISVHKTKLVRIHKGRENANGSFSIGKTWEMYELSAVENYVHSNPQTPEGKQHKLWAKDTGFLVTIVKPYYWEAHTAKEKEFFIGSMVKVYTKFTDRFDRKQGKYPILTGFADNELETLTDHRPYAATEEGRAAHDAWMAPYTNRDNEKPPPEDPGPYARWEKARQAQPRHGPPPRPQNIPPPGDTRRMMPPQDRELNRNLSEERDMRRMPPPGERDMRRPPPPGERRPPPRGPPRPITAEGEPRQRRPGPPPMSDRADPAIFSASPGDGRIPPISPRFAPPGMGTPPPPGLQAGRGRRPSMDQNLRSRPSRENMALRPSASRERLQPMPGSIPPVPIPSPARLDPQSSRSELRPKTPDTTASASSIPSSRSPGRPSFPDDARSERSGKSMERPSFDGPGPRPSPGDELKPSSNGYPPPPMRRDLSPRGLRPGTAQSTASSVQSRGEDPAIEEARQRTAPPERRRPPMERPAPLPKASFESGASGPNTEFHTPAQSPPPLERVPLEPPPRKRPQEVPDKPKPSPADAPAPVFEDAPIDRSRAGPSPAQLLPLAQPPPPPTSPLPQIPKAFEQKERPLVVESPVIEQFPAVIDIPTTEPLKNSDKEMEKESEISLEVKPVSPTADDKESTPASTVSPVENKLGKAGAANAFRKIAKAAGAFNNAGFVPRAGGAAAKRLQQDEKKSDEPDGISAVFVPKRPAPKEEVKVKEEETKPKAEADRTSKDRLSIQTEVVPEVKVSAPLSPTPVALKDEGPKLPERAASPSAGTEQPASKPQAEPEVRRKRRRSNQQMTNISRLGIDPNILDERGLEFETLLSEFGWGSSELSAKNIESLESDIKREIARVEAGSWLNHLEQKDDRVEAVEKLLDRAIAECDELEGLLTLYNVELSSLNDDIAFIEAQSQGLQVQTANQRLLQNELRQLVDTISITEDQLIPLRREPIGKVNGLRAIEGSLVLLYKALITIDPAFVDSSRAVGADSLNKITNSGFGNSELASMQALQEKKDRYLNEGAVFLDRLKKHMEITFGAAFLQTKETLERIDTTSMPSTKANIAAHDAGRDTLWMLSPVVLFAKEIDRASWDALLRMYQNQAGAAYQTEVRDNILSWKRFARKPTGDEQELLFTAQEKEPESITGAARKLTVKRSQTLARGLRAASGDKEVKANKTQDGKLFAFDVFARVLEDIGPVLLTEQNFVTEFFHATSTDSVDFPEAVARAAPENRRGPNLWVRKQYEADRSMAKRVAEVMEDIFSFWPTEIQNLVEWAVNADPLQGVGILCAVDRKLVEIEESNQDFLTRNLQKVHERLTGLFSRFVDEQIRAIEDTKVKIKKRKGVIAFMKTFPHFSMAIENMLPAADEQEHLEIRRMVDDAYQKINKAMFESLKVIAKESPTVMATQGQADPEDKEALNYHILLIENMNHYLEEVDARSDPVLMDWKVKAQDELREHMDLYVDAVIRRPLGKLLEFVESTETLLTQPGASAPAIAQRSSHSRSVFKKLVHSYDAKEIRKGIEALKKRVDKHFGDADDPTISRDLVFKVLKECEKKYDNVYDRTIHINQDVYSGEVEIDWSSNDIATAFRR
ncbi:hypothetical protein SLS60_006802 [Paraconiothyrium brasiliense]|uniref:Exocyst complex component Sec3 PIP2-binding N-terminal domain-containing protein n=1 Tax=Paraconiothyrium brasiliense TaxID=300254 RepID=A0ABR3R8X2_9PLEO